MNIKMGKYVFQGVSIQNQRSQNMDRLLIKEKKVIGGNIYLAAVCDGVGSLEDGAFAASIAIHMLDGWIEKIEDTDRLGLRLRDAVIEINKQIVMLSRNRNLKTASTLSAILIAEKKYYIVHLGDSRIYSYCEKRLFQLTNDHVSNGRLTNCLGLKEQIDIFYNEGLYGNALFFLCSDGLYKKMDEKYFQEELDHISRRRLRKVAKRLMQYVIQQGETDNISLVILLSKD